MTARPFLHVPAGAITFGAGVAASAGTQGPLKRAERVLVLCDRGVRAAGLVDGIVGPMGARVALLDDGVVPDADVRHIDDVAGRAREARVDAVLAIGGGSVLDTAKAVAAVLAKGKSIVELEGMATIRTRLLPLVCVPTTAGTGSEASQFLVVKDVAAGRKRITMDAALVPVASFLDPSLLVGLPRAITAATGVDAIAHALEAAASTFANPLASAAAAEALRLLVGAGAEGAQGALARSLARPDDVEARGAALLGAHLAGQAISSAMLGACHAFGHALGALKGVPHGVANGVFLVPVLETNATAASAAYARLAEALGLPGDERARCRALVALVERLVHDVAGIPRSLGALGLGSADVDDLVRLTLGDADLGTNPVPLDEDAVRSLICARL